MVDQQGDDRAGQTGAGRDHRGVKPRHDLGLPSLLVHQLGQRFNRVWYKMLGQPARTRTPAPSVQTGGTEAPPGISSTVIAVPGSTVIVVERFVRQKRKNTTVGW